MKLTMSALTGSENETALPLPVGTASGSEDSPKKRGRPKGSTNKTSLVALEEKLKEKLLEDFLVPVAFASPLAAANIEARAERTAKAACRLAAKNPRVRAGLEKLLDGSDLFTVALFPLTTALCVMVDFGMMPPGAMPARAAGIPKLWETVYPDHEQTDSGVHNGFVTEPQGLMRELA